MYEKAKLFEDKEMMVAIRKAPTPGQAKKLGRRVKNFDKYIWNELSRELFFPHLVAKFEQNPTNLEALMATGTSQIAEASPFDRIWGIGYGAKKAVTVPQSKWGENRLGKLLVDVRDHLRKKIEKEGKK